MIKREEATRAIGFLHARLGEVQEAENTSAFDRLRRRANRA
jgi:hypothetical protein